MPIEFYGNRKMIKWAFDNTKIPKWLIYETTGFTEKQIDEWINNPKSLMTMDDLRKICVALVMPTSAFFLDKIPEPDKFPTIPVLEGVNFILSKEEINSIRHSVNKALKSNKVATLKMGLHHVLRYLEPYIDALEYY